MKTTLALAVIVWLCAVVQADAASVPPTNNANWNEYVKLSDRYYEVDLQPFQSVTCHVQDKLLGRFVTNLRQVLEKLHKKIVVSDTLKDFTVTYKHDGNVKLVNPTLSITAPESSIANPAKFQRGQQEIHAGFAKTLDGIGKQVTGLFKMLESPRLEKDARVEDIQNYGGVYRLTVVDKDGRTTYAVDGNRIHGKADTPSGNHVTLTYEYADIAGSKPALQHAHVVSQGSMENIDLLMDIDYQPVKSAFLPHHLQTHMKLSAAGGVSMQEQDEISLEDCQLTGK